MRIVSTMKPTDLSVQAKKIPSKKATNICFPMDVYLDAKALGINFSQLCERSLREEIIRRKEQQWNKQHAEFLTTYNGVVEAEGVALQDWRAF
jgi:antitoxin CcdA